MTQNLKKRLDVHNSGGSFHTAKYRPWQLVGLFGLLDKKAASNFEKYLKSGSGRALCSKHFLNQPF